MTHTRRRRAYQWNIAHLLHIAPADLAAMSVEDVETACRWVDAYQRAQQKGR